MAITTLSMVLTVMVLNLHAIADRPVPRWAQIILLRYFARLFCLGPPSTESPKETEQMGAYTNEMRMKRLSRISTSLTDLEPEEHIPIIAINGTLSPGPQGPEHASNNNARYMRSCFVRPGEEVVEEPPPDYAKDWHMLAEVVDRLFFWTFLLAIVAISILLFHPLSKTVMEQ